MPVITHTLLLGIGATAAMDLWGLIRPLFGAPAPDYALVGRWVGHMRDGRFTHAAIGRAAPVRGERTIGWVVHYGTGIAFAALLVLLAGESWLRAPDAGAAFAVGIGSLAAPFLVMQPAMGAGIAARRTPRPGRARLQSLLTHAVFGAGLYGAGVLLTLLPA